MKFCVLASGSKGNLTYIETNNTKILIDAGFHIKRLREELKAKILILMKSRPYLLHMNIMTTWHIYQLFEKNTSNIIY